MRKMEKQHEEKKEKEEEETGVDKKEIEGDEEEKEALFSHPSRWRSCLQWRISASAPSR